VLGLTALTIATRHGAGQADVVVCFGDAVEITVTNPDPCAPVRPSRAPRLLGDSHLLTAGRHRPVITSSALPGVREQGSPDPAVVGDHPLAVTQITLLMPPQHAHRLYSCLHMQLFGEGVWYAITR
jgi:hypothetical protein